MKTENVDYESWELYDTLFASVHPTVLMMTHTILTPSTLNSGPPGSLCTTLIFRPYIASLEEETILPIPKAELFMFRDTKSPEASILLKQNGGNLLIAFESLQCQWDNPFINMPTRAIMQLSGLMDFPLVISPKWLKSMSPKQGSLRDDFERLLWLDFDKIIGASGNLVYKGAKEGVVVAVDAFPVRT